MFCLLRSVRLVILMIIMRSLMKTRQKVILKGGARGGKCRLSCLYSPLAQSLIVLIVFPMDYNDLLAANPYRNYEYRQSGWQRFLSSLGFRTNYDAYKESMALQAAEYDSQVANKQYNEEYETPLAEASRMRAAGQNPDLLGTGDVAGAAAPDLGDENPPVAPESDEGQVLQFANVIMSGITMAFGLGKDIQSLVNMGIVNRAGELQNTEKVSSFAKWLADELYLSPEVLNSPAVDASTGLEVNPRGAYADSLYNQYKHSIPRRYRRQFRDNLATSIMSFASSEKSYEHGRKYLGDIRDYAIQRGRESFKYGTSQDAISIVVKPLSELADKVEKAKLKFEANKATFDEKLYDPEKGLNPSTQAQSQNIIAAEAGQSAQIQREIDSAMKEIVSGLKKNADKGDFFAKMLLLTFSLQRMTGAPGALLKGVGNLIGM